MTREDVISWLEYLSDDARSKADGLVPTNIEIACGMAIEALKAQDIATIQPKRIELADETKAWLDEMDAVDALGNIADICIDWDGYRTANELGGLINEIWAYARYCADRLAKAQEPVEPIIETHWETPSVYENDVKVTENKCGACGAEIDKWDKYCGACGRAVKWK